jgi:hypothetical protein
MDLTQTFIVYAEWIFFTGWGMALAAVSAVAFGRDIRAIAGRSSTEKKTPVR